MLTCSSLETSRLLIFLLVELLATYIFPAAVSAQNTDLYFEPISSKQGVSHSIVKCVLQDKQGFMWFGTKDGLDRFDGFAIVSYEHSATNKHSLSNNDVKCLYEDASGSLWVGTNNGLNRWDQRTGAFFRYLHTSNQASRTISIDCIYEDQPGTLWIGSNVGLYKLDKATGKTTLYEHDPGNPTIWRYNRINTIYEDRQRNLWVGTSFGISLFDRKKSTFTRFGDQPDAIPDAGPYYPVYTILEDREGILWVSRLGKGLHTFDRKTGKIIPYQQETADPHTNGINFILSMREDSFGTLWIGTQNNGLIRFDKAKRRFQRYVYDYYNPHSISNNSITSIYEDRSQVLWIATYSGGVNKLDLLRKKFTFIKHNPLVANALSDNHISAIFEDHAGYVWIGTWLGLERLDRRSGQITPYPYDAKPLTRPGQNSTNAIYEDKAGQLWVGVYGTGLKRLDKERKHFTSYFHNSNDSTSIAHNIINTFYEDRAGVLWLGTRAGLSKFDAVSGRFITYNPSFITNKTYTFNVNTIVEDSLGSLWIDAGTYGLYRFNCKTGIFTSYKEKCVTSRTTATITTLYKDHAGRLWMGMENGGLHYLDLNTNTFHRVVGPQVLSKTTIVRMLEDEQGNLWLTTSKHGMFVFNVRSQTALHYGTQDGLQGNEFLSGCFKNAKGEMYFGGINGLNLFHPSEIRTNPHAPLVAISGFKVFDSPRTFSNEITLPYKDNFFSFDFVALSYALPEQNSYAYQLEGFDQEWIRAGNRRYASYTNLDAGTYIFRVKAANHDGVWNEKATAVKITITPPFWKTKLAYFFYALLVVASAYALRYYTMAQERLKNNLKLKSLESEKLQELDQLKSRFFTSVSHEFRTPLSLIISPLEKKLANIGDNQQEQQEFRLMHRNAQRLLELINQLLDISKLEAGKMTLEADPGDIVLLLRTHVLSFLSLAESKRVRLHFRSEFDSLPALFDKDKVEKIITNLVSNAVKFTPSGGTVTVTVSVASKPLRGIPQRWVVLEVKDTGIGIPAERMDRIFDRFYQVDNSHTREYEGTGIGLALTKELVELHRGSINVRSELAHGTCFTVELPLQEISIDVFLGNAPDEMAQTPVVKLNQESLGIQELPQVQNGPETPVLLIVEDNADLRSYIRNTFYNEYQVIQATNGEEGLQAALTSIPDLIISDWMMPKMDGMQLCQQLKADERTSHIPLILLTAKATIQSKIEGLENGADDYITKPFNATELCTRVKNLISQRRLLRERFRRELALTSTVLAPSEPDSEAPVSLIDQKFLQRVIQVIETNLADSEFSIELLEREVGMSHVHFNRKLKALTDQTPSEFLRNLRLKKAKTLLAQQYGNVSEIAYQVGFSDPSYFTRCFRKLYGMTPVEYTSSKSKEG